MMIINQLNIKPMKVFNVNFKIFMCKGGLIIPFTNILLFAKKVDPSPFKNMKYVPGGFTGTLYDSDSDAMTTISAFSRRLRRKTNTMTILEEFNHDIDLKLKQSIKGAYCDRGRIMSQEKKVLISNKQFYFIGYLLRIGKHFIVKSQKFCKNVIRINFTQF